MKSALSRFSVLCCTLVCAFAAVVPSASAAGGLRGGGVRGLSMGVAPAAEAPAGATHANAHALIMAIGAYPSGVPGLAGTGRDIENARAMARGFGVSDSNVTVLKDGELTSERMQLAFQGLERLAQGDEELFVYFSGHGSRICAGSGDALLMADGKAVSETEFDNRLRKLAEHARRVIVFVDAGHAPSAEQTAALRVKYWAADGGCPANSQTRGLAVGKDPYTGSNYVKVAAVGSDEPAFETADLGGLATHAWASCLGGRAVDGDASSGLSVHELQACAGASQRDLIGAQTASASPQPAPASAPVVESPPVVGNADMVVAEAPIAPAESAQRPPDPAAALRDIHANRDDRRQVGLRASQEAYRIGHDEVGFEISSSHAGYAYLLMVGSDGTTFDLLFPNRKDAENRIEAGGVLSLPRPEWRIRAGGPAGVDHLLALVADGPRDFSGLDLRAAGPFSIAAVTPGNTRGLRVATEQAASTAACKVTHTLRTLQIGEPPASPKPTVEPVAAEVPECSNSYGAALITIREVE